MNGERQGADPLRHDIAIIGIGCRFPGGIVDTASFWNVLHEGIDAIGEIPPSRIDLARFHDPRPAIPGKIMTRFGGYLDSIDSFDAPFFALSPREAERLDPQHRLLLETAWEALEDAGLDTHLLEGSRTGVFTGQWITDFESRLFADPDAIDFEMTTGSGRYASSGRLSYALGLRGPCLSVDTACSSSLAAVHLAVQSLRSGESRLAIAGGVNVILSPHISIAYSQSRMMAPDGRCKFGDARGDGYVRSEGAGLVVLKPLGQALADGHRIHAVIRGSAVNNDGNSSGSMGRPSSAGQAELLRSAYADAGVPAATIGYMEAHGTGTRTGDPIELGALGQVLDESRKEWGRRATPRTWVGSVKTNIGHTEGAAGVAGLIKAVLALAHRRIPRSLHFEEPNPAVPWNEAPFAIPESEQPWPAIDGVPRRAGVSAFGITGTNAHVVLEETPRTSAADGLAALRAEAAPAGETAALDSAAQARSAPILLPLSARSDESLAALAARYARLLAQDDAPPLADLAFSAATRRTPLARRAAFVAATPAEMIEQLDRYASGPSNDAAATGSATERVAPKIAFVLPGQGGQFAGMARELMQADAVFGAAIDACDEAARPWLDVSIRRQIMLDEGDADWQLDRIDVIQPALVAVGIAYARWLAAHGIAPDAVIGHSMGEVAAAHLAGALDLPEAMKVICRRSALMRRVSGQGAMASIELSMQDASKRLRGREESLSIAVSNSPRSTVISGDPQALAEVLEELERDGVFCRRVKVDIAAHSPQMAPLAALLRAELEGLAPQASATPIYSSVTGALQPGEAFTADYWARNLREPVQFSSTLEQVLADGVTVFVELGPHPVLLPSIDQVAAASGHDEVVTVACARRGEPEEATARIGLGRLWASGARLDWTRLDSRGPQARPWVSLPAYPWNRERHWLEAASVDSGTGSAAPRAPRIDDESRAWLYRLQWQAAPLAAALPSGAATGQDWLVVMQETADDHGADQAALVDAVATALGAAGARTSVATLSNLGTTLRSRTRAPTALLVLCTGSSSGQAARASEACSVDTHAAQPAERARHAPEPASPAGRAAFVPLQVIQAVEASGSHPTLWFVTRGAQVTGLHDDASRAPVCIEAAALWGAARVVAEEHRPTWGGLVDLDPAAPASAQAASLARHLLSGDAEDQCALRLPDHAPGASPQRLALRLMPAEPAGHAPTRVPVASHRATPEDTPATAMAPSRPFAWRADASYLVTGGTGGIGVQVALAMARAGARRLVLAGRSSLPPRNRWAAEPADTEAGRRIAGIRAIEAAGAAVHVVALDVGDDNALAGFLDTWEAEAWPRIRGVVHAAGRFDNDLAVTLSPAQFDATMRPKLDAARTLDRLLPDLDLFALFSSTGAFLAQPGQAGYAAANAGLDALAADRHRRGLTATCIDWGVWQDTGLVRGAAGERNVAEMARQGLHGFAADKGVALFMALAGRNESHLAVIPADWAAYRSTHGASLPALLREVAGQASAGSPGGPGLAERLASASRAERKQLIEAVVREAIGRVLKLAPERLDPRKVLGQMGLNSLMAIELRNRLEAALARPLSATLAWNHPSVHALVEHLAGPHETPAAAEAPAAAASPPQPAGTTIQEGVAQVLGLSDEDALAALRRRRPARG